MQKGKYRRTLAIASLAARRLVGNKSNAFVAERLGQLRGLPQKVGQILALNDLTGEGGDYRALTESEGELAFAEVRALVEAELGCTLEERFEHFDEYGIGASLSQVHRAKTRAGRDVAVKVQYPGMEEAIESDLRALGWLSTPVGNLRKGFDLEAYRQHIGAIIAAELDYEAEAENLRAYADSLGELEGQVLVPQPLEKLSSRRVLTMSYLSGQTIEEVAQSWDRTRRAAMAQLLVRHFAYGILQSGLLHGDPHPGNIRFVFAQKQPQILLYDFGCLYRLGPEQRHALRYLIAAADDEALDPWEGYLALGFNGTLLESIRTQLPAVNRLLFAPFVYQGPFALADWNLGKRLQELLGENRLVLRLAGPPELLLLMRGFQGLLQYLRVLGELVNWSAVIRPYMQEIEAPTPPVMEPTKTELDLSQVKHLYVRVVRDGQQKVKLSFPARTLNNLPDLIPPDGIAILKKQGSSPEALLKELARAPVQVGEIFAYGEGEMQVRIWVE